MDHFNYNNGELYAEEVAIKDISNEIGTPFYCYSTATFTRHFKVLQNSFKKLNHTICFALKSNSNLAVLKTLAKLDAGGDCVSEGEIRKALAAGIPSDKIVFSGVGKTEKEIRFALENNIMQFNIESLAELDLVNRVALSVNKKAPIAFRVNPDVDAGTHHKISTGRKEDKFGIAWDNIHDVYQKAAQLDGIDIKGIATHIGSQITSLDPFRNAFARIVEITKKLREKGYNISRLDLGGGLGIPYKNETPPTPEEYAQVVVEAIGDLDIEIAFEPGRVIAGNAGILVTSAIGTKVTASDKRFLVIDAAMNDLMRPALYNSDHNIIPVDEVNCDNNYEVVGPICETGDSFGSNHKLPDNIKTGELFAIRSSGAYGAAMASEYNMRPLIPEIMVNGDQFAIIRKRPSYEEMIAKDIVPDWL